MNRTLYDVLQVSPDASQQLIEAAYRTLAKTSHPDRGGDAETMAQLNDAFEVLRDPQRRVAYDSALAQRATDPAAADVPEELRAVVPTPPRWITGHTWKWLLAIVPTAAAHAWFLWDGFADPYAPPAFWVLLLATPVGALVAVTMLGRRIAGRAPWTGAGSLWGFGLASLADGLCVAVGLAMMLGTPTLYVVAANYLAVAGIRVHLFARRLARTHGHPARRRSRAAQMQRMR